MMIKALNSNDIKSKCLYECIKSLDLDKVLSSELIWVPGLKGIEKTKRPINMHYVVSTLDEDMACNDLLTPLDAMANKIDDWALRIISTK